MEQTRLSRVVALYEGRGLLERVQGDTAGTAAAWLALAKQDLTGIQALVGGESYRLAFNGAYDTLRHAAEAVVQRAGGRVTSGLGGHEAIFAIADALVGEAAPGVFAGTRAGTSRLKRHSLEYLSDNPVTVNDFDVREVLQWAKEAVSAAESFLARSSAPTI